MPADKLSPSVEEAVRAAAPLLYRFAGNQGTWEKWGLPALESLALRVVEIERGRCEKLALTGDWTKPESIAAAIREG